MDIINSVVLSEFNPIKKIFTKLILKMPYIGGQVEVKFAQDDEPILIGITNNFIKLLQKYKSEGKNKGEVVEIIQSDLDKYKVTIRSLPTMVYKYWDSELYPTR